MNLPYKTTNLKVLKLTPNFLDPQWGDVTIVAGSEVPKHHSAAGDRQPYEDPPKPDAVLKAPKS